MRAISGRSIVVFFAVTFVSLLLSLSIVLFPIQFTLKLFVFIITLLGLFFAFSLRSKSNIFPNKLLYFSLAALIFFSIVWPRYVFLTIDGLPKVNPFNLSHLMGFLLVTFVLLLTPEFSRRYRFYIANNALIFYGVLFLLIWQLVSSIKSTYYPLTLSGYFSVLVLYTFFFIGMAFSTIDDAPSKFFKLLIASCAIVTSLGLLELIIQKNLFAKFITYDSGGYESILVQSITSEKLRAGSYRVQSVFTHPILLAQYLVAVIPVVFGLTIVAKSWSKRLFYLILISSALVVLYKTGSRSGIFSLAVTTLYFFGMLWLRALLWGRKSKLVAVFILPILLFSIPVVYFGLTELVTGRSVEEYQSSHYRLQMLNNATQALRDDWLLGFGNGTALIKAGIKSSSGLVSIDSYYLTLAVEGGYLAAGVFIGIFLYMFIRNSIFSLKQSSQAGFELLLVNTSMLGLFMVFSILSTMHNLSLYWILMTLSFYFYNRSVHSEKTPNATKENSGY